VPRAFHSGFYGYNRRGRIEGGLRERIRILSDTIYDPQAIRQAVESPEMADSCLPSELQLPSWTVLRQLEVAAST
jgi:hypothetical protein